MPIYEYKCRNCGKVSEIFFRSFRHDEKIICRFCRSPNLEKLYSLPVVNVRQSNPKGTTCCGSTERCDQPPCSEGGSCRRD